MGVSRLEAECKSPLLAALSRTPRDIGTKAGLRGWRCSANRAGLPPKFPANREFYREFREIWPSGRVYPPRNGCAAGISLTIP